MDLQILYKDANLVAINKPHGLLVHRSPIASEEQVFAIQLLRDQLGEYVHPVHRLDRKTSGVLLFCLNRDFIPHIQQQFVENNVQKTYFAIVRGFTPREGHIDYPLKRDDGKLQDAVTDYRTLQQTELPIPFGRYETSRYSLVEVYPKTGRMHQIRKHFAHIHHPIIGDRPHGCNKQNRFFKERWNMTTMMLHASQLNFVNPVDNKFITIRAEMHDEFRRMLKALNFK